VAAALPFARLDYVYTPSPDVESDVVYARDILGGRVIFTIEAMGGRVAMVELVAEGPRFVFADHLDVRVESLELSVKALEAQGWQSDRALEIPQGACHVFRTAGGQRLAIYERSRPQVEAGFEGRLDF
jgi:hypothetical protein